jgi:hypothetical protein
MGKRFDPLTLDDYIHAGPIEVVDKNPHYPIIQKGFLPTSKESPSEKGLNSKMAQFYEILTAAITGGKWNRNQNLLRYENGHLHPDVIHDDMLIDAKAIRLEGPLKLRDIQFDQYFLHQGTSTDNRQIFYSIFRYGINNPLGYLGKKENALDELVSIFSKKTDFMILLPFSAAINMHNPNCSPFSRYEKNKKTGKKVPDPLTQIPQSGLVNLFNSPEDFLLDCNINPENYNMNRFVLPAGIRMNGNEITPFPILTIEDKDYESWLAEFRLKSIERIKELQEKIKVKRRKPADKFTAEIDFG